ncbi:hypothetical protein [Bacteroides bouchesdurhonensis]|uniref:hypothetical protein n=1 Tax=Bacteroides bouchesdurhonensis TaxID=1841855 RepID=UPI00097F7059|nr:hypothetical protein [Bacteroides bouchesdurhonensis]
MKHVLIYVFLLILMCGCLKRHPKKVYPALYGVEHNRVRDSLGIVLLDSSWVAGYTWEVGTFWEPREEQPYPCHTGKQMGYFNDTLYCELDYYYNGEHYKTPDGTNAVYLTVMYFYRSSHSGPLAGLTYSDTIGWYYVYDGEPGSKRCINKAEADSILESWSIKIK